MAVSDGSGSSDIEEEELQNALMACDFPLVVWSLADTPSVRLANPEAARLLGRPLSEMPGLPILEMLAPRLAVRETVELLASGSLDSVHGDRSALARDGSTVPVRVWTRAIPLQQSRAAVSLIVPISEIARLGRDPSAPWRELAQIAVGTAGPGWLITQVSRDAVGLLGRPAAELIGSSLLEVAEPSGADMLRRARPGGPVVSVPNVAFRHRDGTDVVLCVLAAPHPTKADLSYFALVGWANPPGDSRQDRVTELEMRLRRIGAEVRASGVLDGISVLASPGDVPELAGLTARQWEILSRLVGGARVPTIASDLFLSQSTVRNHLATIFRKFGVHSQAELLTALRQRQDEALHA